MNKEKILITGGAGFIGSHLAEAYLKQGHSVSVIDNLSTGSMDNIAHLVDKPNFQYTIGDVADWKLMEKLVKEADMIFHLAAAVGVKLVVEDPVRTIETNISGTESVLKLAAKDKKRVVIASTSEVYGKSNKDLFSEDDDLILGPTSKSRWCYAASKIVDEFLAKAYFKEYGLPAIIVRFFNTVGPRQTGQYGMVIPNFVRQALANEPITVFGDGEQRRSFTWVGDVVNALMALVQNPDAAGEVFNIGHGKDISINELAALVKKMTASDSDITKIPYDQAYERGFEDMSRRMPDISKINRLIGYKPTLDLGEILERIIGYHRDKILEPATKKQSEKI